MHQTGYKLLLMILLLALLAACGGNNEENSANNRANQAPANENTAVVAETAVEPTTPPTAEPTAAPAAEPTAEPVVEEETTTEELEALDIVALTGELNVNTYHYLFTMSATVTDDAGEEITQDITADIKFSVDPPANSFIVNMEGIENEMGGMGQISITQIGDTSYTYIPEFGCITSSTATEDPFSDFSDTFSPDTFLEELDITQVKRVRPNETINGIEVRHYTFDEELLNADADPGEEIENAEGHIYIAEDGGYLVKMVMTLEGSGIDFFDAGNEGQVQSINFSYELISVNEALDIAIPAECEAAGSGSGYPLLADAFEVTSFASIMNYRSAVSVEEAIIFYDAELAALGYTKSENESFVVSGSAILVYTQEEGPNLNLIINEADGGGISVTISAE